MRAEREGARTSRERMLAVASGLPTDRVPVTYRLNPL
jgi:hypothetical protein